MWKEALSFGTQVFNLARRMTKGENDIKDQQEQINDLQNEVRGLASAIQEIRLEMKYDRESAARDRRDAERAYENLVLRLEVALLRSGHALPTALQLPAVEDE